ncbi:MAG: tRNA-dihydrouridine synthase family protein [Bacteroidales bacterium]|nr:tRNA-dihydrouridine synthase family protein [Bacteroidales bacterium]
MGLIRLIPTESLNYNKTVVFNYSLFSQEDKLILAPMQNLTNSFYRKAFEKFFSSTVDYAVSPFISVSSTPVDEKSILFDDIRKENNINSLPLVPQIIGNNVENIVQTCKIMEQFGYKEVNLNMGCPKRDIVSRQRGAGLLTDEKKVEQIIKGVLEQTHLSLSIKVRTGVKNDTDFERMLPMINSYPLKSVCIHARRAIDFYEGSVDIEKFEFLTKKLKHTIIYNGDIFSKEDFTTLKTRFPYIKNWMLGRGLLRNPFLAGEIRGINFDKNLVLKPFIKEIKNNFVSSLRRENETIVLNKMKEFSKYICQGLNLDSTPFTHSKSLSEITTLFETCL